jgi:hypothetical protein
VEEGAKRTRDTCVTDNVGMVTAKIIRNLKNGVFCGVTPCGSCKNGRFGGTERLTLFIVQRFLLP